MTDNDPLFKIAVGVWPLLYMFDMVGFWKAILWLAALAIIAYHDA